MRGSNADMPSFNSADNTLRSSAESLNILFSKNFIASDLQTNETMVTFGGTLNAASLWNSFGL